MPTATQRKFARKTMTGTAAPAKKNLRDEAESLISVSKSVIDQATREGAS